MDIHAWVSSHIICLHVVVYVIYYKVCNSGSYLRNGTICEGKTIN